METQTQQKNTEQKNEELGALWKRTSQQGQKYLAGHIKVGEFGEEQTIKVVVFQNGHKNNDKQPDFRMYKSKAPVASVEVSETDTQNKEEQDEESLL
jgi:uncharacterized protein (DUF736 family)